MKSRQLLSVVFSLIMFTGVTAGNAAFAESDDLDDILEDFCELNVDPDTFFTDNEHLAEFSEEIIGFCILNENERDFAIDEFINDNFPEAIEEEDEVIEDYEDCVEADGTIGENPNECTIGGAVFVNDDDDDVVDSYEDCVEADGTVVDNECTLGDMVFVNDEDDDDDDSDKVLVCHKDKTLSIDEHAIRAHLGHGDFEGHCDGDVRAYSDEYSNKGPGNLGDHMAMFCDMTVEEREAKVAENHPDLSDELRAELLSYCEMSEDEQDDFRDIMMDKMDKIHDSMQGKMTDKKEKHHDKMEKFSEKSDRLKAMIMDKRDISDERHDEIKMKYEEKFGEDSDEKRTEIKKEYKKYVLKMKFEMSEERKSDIHDRVAEMKAYKAELREQSSEITDEEKQQLREEFIEKAKDMQLAWISPRTQMTAGIDATEVECREGFSLVMKVSNGVAMCLKADSALNMIDRGIIIPAN